jgi:hypothetical protein
METNREMHIRIEGEEPSSRELIGYAIGEASMCWDPIPFGVFRDQVAATIVDDLVKDLGLEDD